MAGTTDSWNLFSDVVTDNERRDEIILSIRENAKLDLRFVFMNALAGVVASYGLLSNSAATVIGAMLMATLLGAITGVALALLQRESALLRESLLAAGVGVVVVFSISLVIGFLNPWIPLSSEIIARTHPSLLDLGIAIAGGAAGAYAMVSPRVSAGLVGVAIATALVPPIAASGICLSRGEYRLALGAAELFVTNFAAIQFINSVMMWLFGFRKTESVSWMALLSRNSVSLVVLLILAVLLSLNFVRSIRRFRIESSIRRQVTQAVNDIEDAELIRLDFSETPGEKLVVKTVVITPIRLSKTLVSEIQANLLKSSHRDIELRMLYLLSETFEEPAVEPEPSGPMTPSLIPDSDQQDAAQGLDAAIFPQDPETALTADE